jgi:hypothetical protein
MMPAETMRRCSTLGSALAAGLLILVAACPSPAAARGFVSFHFGVGVPVVVGPPVYYAPPPVYYVPPPVYYVPPPVVTSGSTSSQQQVCHEYQSTATIDGKLQPVTGKACLQPDGTWRISQ